MTRINQRRKICVASSTRADYGHLFWLMKEIQNDPELELQTLVAGTHLEEQFGYTSTEFVKDGFPISARVNSELKDDSAVGTASSMGITLARAASELEKLKPDVLVILGDRFEMLSIGAAAHLLKIPVAHIHGGESTEGAVDEAFRHSLTKISSLHFVAAEQYRQRVIQLGEDPTRVFNFGAPGLDHIQRTKLLSKAELSEILQFNLSLPYLAVVYHPETLGKTPQDEELEKLIDILLKETSFNLLVSKSNADTCGQLINSKIDQLEKKNQTRVRSFKSLGQKGFYSLVKHSEGLVGNSSAGIIDAPALGVVSINIGDRQKGRLRAPSVIDCTTDTKKISRALGLALQLKEIASHKETPYGDGNSSRRIKEILKKFPLQNILNKNFYEIQRGGDDVGIPHR